MAKLGELLKFRSLKRLELITCTDCLDTNVGAVTVMEVPDVIQWLRGEDFLITSFYSIGNDEEKQCRLLLELMDSQSSCLAIKTGKYANQISDKMIAIANENHYPLLHIPYEVTYIDIIMDAMSVLMTESNKRDILSKFISKIIFPDTSNDRMLEEEGHLLKIDLDNDYFQVLVMNFSEGNDLEGGLLRQVKFAMGRLMDFSEKLSDTISCGHFMLDRGALLILFGKKREIIGQYLPFVLTEIRLVLNSLALPYEWKVGIGKIQTKLAGIRNSYLQAVQSIDLGRILKKSERFYRFEDLELYGDLQDMLLKKQGGLFGNALGKLKNHELVDTLMMYFECGGNLEETAGRLFTHKNTVKYRLNKIKEFTGLDVKCQEDNFKLYFMILEKILCGR